jgi:aryl-alcohol dehydrogenase-like predicted oxidoreductase
MSFASKDKTAAYHARHHLPESARCELGATGLTVSRLGFGCYRVDEITAEHAAALKLALRSGINLIDTSTNYTDGSSERLVGRVLRELSKSGELQREEIVVVSKAGYVQGQNLHLAQERERQGRGFSEMVKYMQNCWYCIHPDFLSDQLFRSLARLQLEHLDVLLLHNPEYFLSDALRRKTGDIETIRQEYERRLREAFVFLEKQVAAGRLAYYGVSSNTFPHAASAPEFTSLERLWDIAEAISPSHHFRVIQFPANLFETGAMFEKNQSGGAQTVLEFAREKKLGTLVNRPLNAMRGDRMVRLASFPTLAPAEAEKIFPKQIEALAAAEKNFAQTVFRELHFERFIKADRPIFAWAEHLQEGLALFQNWAHWDHVKQHVIEPQTETALQALREKAGGAAKWEAWETFYRECLAAVIDTLSRYHARDAAADADRLSRQLDEAVPGLKTSAALSQKALRVLLNVPGVDNVLLGMRRPRYVEDALAALRTEALGDVMPALQKQYSH